MKHQAQREEEAFEEFCREVVHTARAEEEVINAAADSPFLFHRVRAHLAPQPERQTNPGFFAALSGKGSVMRWAVAMTAAVIVMAALIRWPRETPTPPDFPAVAMSVDYAPTPVKIGGIPQQIEKTRTRIRQAKAASHRHRLNKAEEREVTTEYLPLTYAAFTGEAEGGHVVRVQVPRAALLTLGVRMNAEPSAELVKADVIVGDDGLARAIRLVR